MAELTERADWIGTDLAGFYSRFLKEQNLPPLDAARRESPVFIARSPHVSFFLR